MGKIVEVKVVGLSFRPGYPQNVFKILEDIEAARAKSIGYGDGEVGDDATIRVNLRRDPNNPHDPNAIEVHYPPLGRGKAFFGFIPAELAAKMAPTLDRGDKWDAVVMNVLVSDKDPKRPGVELRLERLDKAPEQEQ